MELDAGERAVLDRGDDRAAVVDPRNDELVVVGLHGVAVGEVHVGAVETVEDAGRPRARELVPAHVRHGACSQPAHAAAEQSQAFAAFLARPKRSWSPTQMPRTGRPAATRSRSTSASGSSPAAACATWPTPATIASGAAATSAGSVVTTGSAPARARAEQTLRMLPAP